MLAEFDAKGTAKLLPERVIDILIGCALALVGTAAAFPRDPLAEIDDLAEEEPRRDATGRDDGPD